jgi:phosphatidylinositol alpha-1,6-mannosyltransferase
VPDADLPALYGCGDVFAMCCRDRWSGLEQEGFGIVFVEAAAAGVAQVAGDSGGAAEAVVDGETGLVVAHPEDPEAVAIALARLLDDPGLRCRLGEAARRRAEREFTYDLLAARLGDALRSLASS